MKKMESLRLLLVLFALPVYAVALETKDIAGDYQLQGEREMAGLLSLTAADQKYVARFSYGAADWVEVGAWKIDSDTVVLSGGRFKATNYKDMQLLLASGTRFSYEPGKLTSTDPSRPIVFLNPDKTPPSGTTGVPGEGRMLVQGDVVKIDDEIMVVKVKGECIDFSMPALSPEVRKVGKKGATIDVEIPYSTIIGGETCPTE
jgi:hypothetical protein